jgi:hypothetical protein
MSMHASHHSIDRKEADASIDKASAFSFPPDA